MKMTDKIIKLQEYTKKFDHVIWDWNGTVMDDVDIALAAVNPLLKSQGLTELCLEGYRSVFGFPIKNYYEKIGFDFSLCDFEELSEDFHVRYNDLRIKSGKVFDDVVHFIRHIAIDKTHSILSAGAQWHLEDWVKQFQVESLFQHIYGIEDIYGACKISRGKELIDRHSLNKEKTVMIGDTVHDLEVAEAMGVSCILVADGHQNRERLQAVSSVVI